ncbi:aspartic proteinase CDR1 [Daucus carota subsp. sativus]
MSRTRRVFAPKLATSKSKIQSSLTADPGEYLMKISVGTPPVNFLAIADTGSDVTWIQCKPCTECYEQKAPLFDPKKSSTYKKQHCNSINCHASGLSCDDKQFCTYSYTYGDGSFSAGDMSSDSFTFESTWGKPVVLPKITFGCGHSSGGNFDNVTDGIVGLGNSDLSIINQLSYTINGKFAYCMVPVKVLNASSKIKFGSDAVVSGYGAQKTPFFAKNADTFYHLDLKGVSVGETRFKFETKAHGNRVNSSDGNIIIDSGTTLTFLPSEVYSKVETEFKRKTSLKPVQGDLEFSLCYKNEKGFEKKVPKITFHFSGADWELSAVNSMLEIEEGKICFTIGDAEQIGIQPIFGNMAQMNYAVGYDLKEKSLSFKRTDCIKQ